MFLFVVIPAAVAVALLGLSMCRLAALSDRNQAVALAEWIAAGYRVEHRAGVGELSRDQLTFDPRRGRFRATG